MGKRTDLHNLLKTVLGSDNVYYQPPASVKMEYPAIVYKRDDIDTKFADDFSYKQSTAYELIVIDKNPDSNIVETVSKLSMCRFVRHYTADNLNHDVFKLYF